MTVIIKTIDQNLLVMIKNKMILPVLQIKGTFKHLWINNSKKLKNDQNKMLKICLIKLMIDIINLMIKMFRYKYNF